jgi:hypothetical protein
MKKLTLSMAALTLLLANSAFANKKVAKTTTATTVTSETAAPRTAASSGSSGMDFAVGLSTWGGVSVGSGIGGPALSAKFNLGSAGSVQALFAMAGSDPFQFAVGGVYRHRVLGDGDPGFHLGAGLNLGLAAGGVAGPPLGGSSFFLNIFPLAGFHFSLGGALKRITLSFDGGLNFHVTPGFQMQAGVPGDLFGGLLGASIHYQL